MAIDLSEKKVPIQLTGEGVVETKNLQFSNKSFILDAFNDEKFYCH